MRNNVVTIRKVDWWLVLLYFSLTFMGLMNIYSASYNPEHSSLFDTSQEYGKQALWLCISLGLAGTIILLEGSFLRNMAILAYIFCMFLLVLVILVGNEVNGAKAWFGIGSFGIQPSEFSKVAISLMLAWYLGSKQVKLSEAQLYTLLIVVFPACLIMLQPDTGTVMVFAGFIFMFYREGLSGNVLLYGFFVLCLSLTTLMLKDSVLDMPFVGSVAGIYAILIVLTILMALAMLLAFNFVMKRNRKPVMLIMLTAWLLSCGMVYGVDYAFKHVLGNHQKERIDIFLGLKEDPDGQGYNIDRAMAAIGSGGIGGKGYLKATLANKNQKHVPMQSTDFIFCTLSEEWGFAGSFTVLAMFMFLLVRLVIVAERQRLPFTRIYAYCVACIFFMHVLINMGMAMGLVPVIGIPLPFFSYGGSSLMAFTILLFILIRLDAERLDVLK